MIVCTQLFPHLLQVSVVLPIFRPGWIFFVLTGLFGSISLRFWYEKYPTDKLFSTTKGPPNTFTKRTKAICFRLPSKRFSKYVWLQAICHQGLIMHPIFPAMLREKSNWLQSRQKHAEQTACLSSVAWQKQTMHQIHHLPGFKRLQLISVHYQHFVS